VREKLEQIDAATNRSGDLARQLLTFSRREIVEMKVLDLNEILTNLNKMLRRAIGEDIEFVTRLAAGLGRIKADPGQIDQIIVNLTVNARDAMAGGGKLVLETANFELDARQAKILVHAAPGPYVLLSVRDTGKGMTPEIRERIFEPFFTTKEEGKGTGLGLFMVYGIVQKYGGHIVVASEPGAGTTFQIYFPRVDEALEAAREEILEAKIPRGRETVLVVEDEDHLRRLMAEVLKQQGYQTLEAANGGEGLLVFDQHRRDISLIVTDIVMPVMNGFELIDLIKPVAPNMKTLYISGYPDNPALQKRSLSPETNFMQKPFSLEDLAIRVRRVLDN
jgi:two-component system, cell cycle sensor histidine kinase and response regulator CckA